MQAALNLPHSEALSQNEIRIQRQLLEALLFEGQLEGTETELARSNRLRFTLNLDGQKYTLYGTRGGFNRVRLEASSVAACGLCFASILAACNSNSEAIQRLTGELEQTLRLSEWNRQNLAKPQSRRKLTIAELEQAIDEGHPYHPCFKARTGFSTADHRLFGPETGRAFQLHWLAVRRNMLRQELPCAESAFWIKEIGQANWDLLSERLELLDADWDEYALLPIHPWQWLSLKQDLLSSHIEMDNVLYLAAAGDSYQATQSVRSLMNMSNPARAHVKLPLNMVNTSSLRTLEPHSVCSSPLISSWLNDVVDDDPYLRESRPLVILQEYAGSLFESGDTQLDGQLAVIWRQSIESHLQKNEAALPFNALMLVEEDGKPFIDDWIDQYSLQAWLKQLFDTSVLPVWHLLLHHGLAIEAHAQNLILLHEDGWPTRLAARDFHESVEYVRDFLREPEREPDFVSRDSRYQSAEPNEFYWMQDMDALRELFVDTLYIYNLADLAHLLEQHYDFAEARFWRLLSTSLQHYADNVGIDDERLARLGMQHKQFKTESLITRKLRYPQMTECHHVVSNPFYSI